MWDLSRPGRDQTHVLRSGRQTFNHWTTREVLSLFLSLRRLGAQRLQDTSSFQQVMGSEVYRVGKSPFLSAPQESHLQREWIRFK